MSKILDTTSFIFESIALILMDLFIVFTLYIGCGTIGADLRCIFGNSVGCTVTKFEYSGGMYVPGDDNEAGFYCYTNLDCIVEFDMEIDGYTEYEYVCPGVLTNQKPLKAGDTGIIIFNKNFKDVRIYTYKQLLLNNILLPICMIISIIMLKKVNKQKKQEKQEKHEDFPDINNN